MLSSPGEWEPLADFGVERARSRSPRNHSVSSANAPQAAGETASVWYELPSIKLGQLLGYKGGTIQRVKEVTGVTRLHIQDKDRAKHQSIVYVEIVGLPHQVSHCHLVLDAICVGDHSELGHKTAYMPVDASMIGKLMGARGQTVKEMAQVTGAYIEILQDAAQGATAGPQLFIAGPPSAVTWAEDLVSRFLASPGSRLDAVLQPGESIHGGQTTPSSASQPVKAAKTKRPLADVLATLPPEADDALQALVRTLSGNGPPGGRAKIVAAVASLPAELSSTFSNLGVVAKPPGHSEAIEPHLHGGDMEETIIEVPARIKGHLLGLHGQTIELVRKTSGVVKCHLEEKGKGGPKGGGTCSVIVVGSKACVKECRILIDNIARGDHSGIGHSTTYVSIDREVVGKIMGHKGQTVRELGQVTGCYIEIIQDDPERPQLFLAGPPDSVNGCVDLLVRFIDSPGSRLESILGHELQGASSQIVAPLTEGTLSGKSGLSSLLKSLAGIPGLEGLSNVSHNVNSIKARSAAWTPPTESRPPLENPRARKDHSAQNGNRRSWY